jgi:hypothetical protein
MPMVLVVSVPVSVGRTFGDVHVIVPLGQVKPDADGRDRRSGEKAGRNSREDEPGDQKCENDLQVQER